MECGPRCWRNKYRREKRWALELCLVEARWLDSMTAREEKTAVVVHDVVCAPVQREFDAVASLLCDAAHDVVCAPVQREFDAVASLLCDAAHAVAVPRELGVFVLGERLTKVQDLCYSCKIRVLHARRLAMEKE